MNITRSEALDIFKKWHAECTSLRCQILTRKFTTAFSARVYSASEVLLILASEDLRTELNIPLTADLFYGYGDNRHHDEDSTYECCIVIFLGPVPEVGYGEMIALSAVKDGAG